MFLVIHPNHYRFIPLLYVNHEKRGGVLLHGILAVILAGFTAII